jgi:hypothetical protein
MRGGILARRRRGAGLAGAVALVLSFLGMPSAAPAADLVVIEARGIDLHPGDVIDGARTLPLKEGQHVTLVSANGATFTLHGPYNAAPGAVEDGGDSELTMGLRVLVTQTVRRNEQGVTRTGVPRVVLPAPWLLNVSRNGIVCLRPGERPVFWRERTDRASSLAVTAGDRTWRAEATWPVGSDQLLVPSTLPITGGKTYRVRLDDSDTVVAVKFVPKTLTTPEMQVAWLAETGCDPQAEALYKTLR